MSLYIIIYGENLGGKPMGETYGGNLWGKPMGETAPNAVLCGDR